MNELLSLACFICRGDASYGQITQAISEDIFIELFAAI